MADAAFTRKNTDELPLFDNPITPPIVFSDDEFEHMLQCVSQETSGRAWDLSDETTTEMVALPKSETITDRFSGHQSRYIWSRQFIGSRQTAIGLCRSGAVNHQKIYGIPPECLYVSYEVYHEFISEMAYIYGRDYHSGFPFCYAIYGDKTVYVMVDRILSNDTVIGIHY